MPSPEASNYSAIYHKSPGARFRCSALQHLQTVTVRQRRWKTPSGEKRSVWQADFTIDGERFRPHLDESITSERAALEAEREIYHEIKARIKLRAAGKAPPLAMERMLEVHAKRMGASAETIYRERSRHKALKNELGVETDVHELTIARLIQYREKRQKDGCGPRGINSEMALLHAALNYAMHLEMADADTVTRLFRRWPKRIPEPKRDRKILSPAELGRLIKAALSAKTTIRGPANRQLTADLITVFAYTGLRPAEMWNIRWRDYDPTHQLLTVNIKKRGGGDAIRQRIVPCLKPVVEILERRARRRRNTKSDALIFGRNHRFAEKLKAAAKAAKLPEHEMITPYDLRHSMATNFAIKEGDPSDLQALMGHSDARITLEVYRHAQAMRTRDSLAQSWHIGKKKSTANPRGGKKK